MATQVLQQKLTVEELTLEFDMLSRLAIGESVVGAIVTSSVYSGVDANPATMIDGSPSIANNVVSQQVRGGLPGVIYTISCSVRTSNNNVLVNEAKLAILTTSAPVPPIS
jgi:hypothetical protein